MATSYAIKWLKDKLGIKFFPVTHLKAVRDDNNVNLETLLGQKQDELISGTNIKTINNNSLVGSGNIDIQGGEANVIESISINGTTQTVTNKNVDLPVPVSVDIDTIVKVTQAAYDALVTKDSSTLYLITS